MVLRTLYQALLHSDIARLRIIALQWGFTPRAVRHTDLAAELVDSMVNAEEVSHVLSALTPESRAALDDLLRHGGMMPWLSFVRRWGPMRDIGMGKMERDELWREPHSASEDLWMLGLVQRDFSEGPDDPIEMAYIPEALRLYMPITEPFDVPSPPPQAPVSRAQLVDIVDALADDLIAWWVSVQHEPVTDTSVSPVPTFPDDVDNVDVLKTHLLQTLSLEQGWIRITPSQELRLVPDAVLAWLRADLWSQWASLARAWMASTAWRDYDYIQSLHPDPVSGWLPDALKNRQRILDIFARCSPGNWYLVADMIAYVKEYFTDFMRPDGNYDRWAPREAQTDRPLRGFESWNLIEGAYITFLITGPLSWLGVITCDDAASEHVEGSRFQLTEAGAALLGLCEPPVINESPAIKLCMDGIVEVPARRRYERYQLSRIAHLISRETGQPGGVFRFRLTPKSLKRAQQQHIPFIRILEFLEQATGQSLPPSFKQALQRFYNNNEYASLDHPWLLRLPETGIEAFPDVHPYILERITSSIILIHEKDVDLVVALLFEKGILVDMGDK